ncbi:dipeptidase PepV [Bacillus benzoevorans]|uniref:Succinyl-diaminopimelate desuccinylase n=1 Tax=Bacillus benzoevorans TaxID=1456 RepID=A0A7X0HS34_9BACI|nr:dipeptidase PepV [Bacillus benzoevorans]MBB6445756.1 succinyl-diaminopimelate desuccinylase [Bacillus benzoevorans]
MEQPNWFEEVSKRKEELINETKRLLQIKSVLDEENISADAPLGLGVKEALNYMLALGEKDGFITKNVDHLAGHIEFGQGDELVGILCHVDVVPEGDGWSSDPFAAEIREGKIFARGAIDDKGPTMGAYFAMKIVKELGLPLQKRVRMIIGTDEESGWRCVTHYFKHEEMPSIGFAPDADFPIIYAEKGIADFDLVTHTPEGASEEMPSAEKLEVLCFQSGRRYNMVPDYANAVLHVAEAQSELVQKFEEFIAKNGLQGDYHVDNGDLILELKGISAHGMEPENGKNAGLYLAQFINENKPDAKAQNFFTFAANYFYHDSRGKGLGIAYSDDISGELTINVGKLSYEPVAGGRFGINLRYPVTHNIEETKERLEAFIEEKNLNYTISNFSDSKPHHVDEDHILIQTLKKVYEEQTGEKAELLAIGGGTYARSLESGVAFGPLFPDREDIAHQKDEYIYIEDLLKATAIYAQAIYELAK